ncbi:MAG: SDR family NAD(P)-dependent oxidoreductase [Gammaproteobacteria bacterium]
MGSSNCVVVGVGPGNGAAFARAFTGEGYRVGLMARSRATLDPLAAELAGSIAITCDVRVPEEIERAFARLRDALGPVGVLIYNAGAGAFEDIDQATSESLESAWRTNALGLFVATRAVLPDMRAQRRGSIIVVGATASLRGGAKFLPFAAAKAAQRSIAQSMARKLWPEGIHVGYVVLDGVVDLPRTRQMMRDKPDEFFLKPEAIADSVLALVRQSPQAWTFELDLRSFMEKW